MVREFPTNIIVSLVVFLALWFISAVPLNGYFADTIAFNELTPEDFMVAFQTLTIVSAVVGYILLILWFLPTKGISTSKPARKWNLLFVLEIVLSLVVFVYYSLTYNTEGLTVGQYVLSLLSFISLTVFPFWICSFFMTNSINKFCVLGKR